MVVEEFKDDKALYTLMDAFVKDLSKKEYKKLGVSLLKNLVVSISSKSSGAFYRGVTSVIAGFSYGIKVKNKTVLALDTPEKIIKFIGKKTVNSEIVQGFIDDEYRFDNYRYFTYFRWLTTDRKEAPNTEEINSNIEELYKGIFKEILDIYDFKNDDPQLRPEIDQFTFDRKFKDQKSFEMIAKCDSYLMINVDLAKTLVDIVKSL
jgi:hypothetical protein